MSALDNDYLLKDIKDKLDKIKVLTKDKEALIISTALNIYYNSLIAGGVLT